MQALEESARHADAERQQLLEMALPDPPLTVAVLFGGCSSAPGLTLASARSIAQLVQTSVGAPLTPSSSPTSASAADSQQDDTSGTGVHPAAHCSCFRQVATCMEHSFQLVCTRPGLTTG